MCSSDLPNDIVSLGKALYPYLPPGKCPCTYCKLLWIRVSAKFKSSIDISFLRPVQSVSLILLMLHLLMVIFTVAMPWCEGTCTTYTFTNGISSVPCNAFFRRQNQ